MKLKALVVAASLALSGLASAQTVGVPTVAVPSYSAPLPIDVQGKLSLTRDDKGHIGYQNELTHDVTHAQLSNAYQQLAQGFWLGSVAYVDAYAQAVDAYNNTTDTQVQSALFGTVVKGGALDVATSDFVAIANESMTTAHDVYPTTVDGTIAADGSTNVSLLEQSNRYVWTSGGHGAVGTYTGGLYNGGTWTSAHVAGEPFAGVLDVVLPVDPVVDPVVDPEIITPIDPVVDVPADVTPTVE